MRHHAKFHQIGQTVVEIWKIWQFNGFQNAGRPPSWICKNSNFLTARAVKRLNLHQHTKFHRDQSRCCGDIAIFCDLQEDGRRHLGYLKIWNFNGRSDVGGPCASLCQISSKSVKRLQRYGDLTFFKKAAVRHLGFVKFEFFNGLRG